MKKILSAVLLLSLMAGCKPKPVVIDGIILGYEGQEVSASLTKGLAREAVEVAEDGTFHIERMLDEAFVGGVSITKSGSCSGLIVPGRHYVFNADLTQTPAALDFTSDCPEEQAFYKYSIDTLLKIDFARYEFPEKFSDFNAMWDGRMEDCSRRIGSIRNRAARRFFDQMIAAGVARYKINFASQLEKRGVAPADDADFMAYFNSVDLSDESMKPLINSMLNIKSGMYSDTIPASVRYIQAINEIVPSQQVRDSVTAKYLDSVIKDGKFSTQSEADFLLATAEGLVEDEELLGTYRERVAKIMSLTRGCDAIDFSMNDIKGQSTYLSDFKGKVVYADFWATWCIPCCMQIPYMKVLAAKYASNPDVACISVSLDSDLNGWKSMLEYDKPAWPQYILPDAGKQLLKDYAFQAIPRFMLFDKEGKIVTVNAPRPQDMDEVVDLIESIL